MTVLLCAVVDWNTYLRITYRNLHHMYIPVWNVQAVDQNDNLKYNRKSNIWYDTWLNWMFVFAYCFLFIKQINKWCLGNGAYFFTVIIWKYFILDFIFWEIILAWFLQIVFILRAKFQVINSVKWFNETISIILNGIPLLK